MTSIPGESPEGPLQAQDEQAGKPSGESELAPADPAGAAARPEAEALPAFPLQESSEPRPPRADAHLPADLRVPWTTRDVILFSLFYLLSPIVIAIPVLIVAAVALHGNMSAVMNDKQLEAILSIIAQAAAALLTLGYLWVLVKAKNVGPFWDAIGWRQLAPNSIVRRRIVLFIVLGGIALAAAVTLASSLIGQKKTLPIEELVQTRLAMILLMSFGVLVAPLVEETVFRGVLFPVIARGSGIAGSIIITGVLFGMVHSLQLWGGWGQIGLIVAVGILLTWVRALRHTVWASFLLHLTYNSTLFLGALYATGGFRHMENMK